MRPPPRPAERGETLVEILVTVVIMGTAFVAILLGVATTFMATDTHRQEATAEGVLRSYAERIKDPRDVPYVDCTTDPDPAAGYDAAARAAGFELPSGFSAEITAVAFWDGANPPTFGGCPGEDHGVQRIDLRVQSRPGKNQATEHLTIVKRRP